MNDFCRLPTTSEIADMARKKHGRLPLSAEMRGLIGKLLIQRRALLNSERRYRKEFPGEDFHEPFFWMGFELENTIAYIKLVYGTGKGRFNPY